MSPSCSAAPHAGEALVPISEFSLESLHEGSSDSGQQSRLHFGRQPVTTAVSGTVLEAQYRCGDCYLLLLTEDTPYEEALHVYLVNPEFEILDVVELGIPYKLGLLTDVRVAGDRRLQFSFFGNDLWQLTVLEDPRRSPPLLKSPARRPWPRLLAKKHLELVRLG
jgi:hypothetical protein